MEDLETRKLKRDWTAINWMGESSSLSGTDAIAWTQLGRRYNNGEYKPGRSLTENETQELELFYRRLSWLLDHPEQRKGKVDSMSIQALKAYEAAKPDGIGRYIAINERLSIPELVKRLITYDQIDEREPEDGKLKIEKLKNKPDDPEFKDIYREAGYWTGWFMGDGDQIGDKLKQLVQRHPDDLAKQERDITQFSELMRNWGKALEGNRELFPQGKGRVIYAGGDDFLGVLYSEDPQIEGVNPDPVKPIEAWNWLCNLPNHWKQLQTDLHEQVGLDCTYSVGFVWAGHQVPQRDILQHCREAEKLAKSKGRDRITIRAVFNSGQYVQWTCPWDYLHVLQNYRDRDGNTWGSKYLNWTHVYNDWEYLKARHAIALKDKENVNEYIALELFDLYFGDRSPRTDGLRPVGRDYFSEGDNCKYIIGEEYSASAIIQWIDGLVKVGWQLCSNT